MRNSHKAVMLQAIKEADKLFFIRVFIICVGIMIFILCLMYGNLK